MPPILPPEELVEGLRRARRLLVTSHANPDGDAIGSELGVLHSLGSAGHEVTVWNADPVPAPLSDLPGTDRIHTGIEPPDGLSSYDAALVLECPTLERTGLPTEILRTLPLLNLDHHLGNANYGSANWVDPDAPAVAELTIRVLDALSIEIPQPAALCFYCAIASDTGGFRFSNAGPRAFKAASRLVTLGASPERVSRWLFESRPRATLELLGPLLSTLEVLADDRLAVVHLTRDAMATAGATDADTEGLVDYPRSIAGIEVVAFLREIESTRTKVSMRSRDGIVDVEKIARAHGGGGHRNAAGCSLGQSIADARAQITRELLAALEKSS